jgi:hypothetical protein
MVTRITFRGLREAHNFLIKLPDVLDVELTKTNQQFMEDLKFNAQQLAPVDTGELRESIELEPVKRGTNVKTWKLVVNAPHGIYQEEGFTPHFAFIRNSSKLSPGRYWVSKWTPFMKPAFEKSEAKYLNMLEVSTNRALARAGGSK